jgi:hypothetical protein
LFFRVHTRRERPVGLQVHLCHLGERQDNTPYSGLFTFIQHIHTKQLLWARCWSGHCRHGKEQNRQNVPCLPGAHILRGWYRKANKHETSDGSKCHEGK